MAKYRITIGSFETDDLLQDLETALADFLAKTGKVSEVPGRGLKVTALKPIGRPGNISRSVMDVLIAKPGLSKQKIASRLSDFEFKQVESALRRLYKAGDITSKRERKGRYTIWYYSATDEGKAKHEATDEAEQNAWTYAKRIWAFFKAEKYKMGEVIDPKLVQQLTGLTRQQVKYALLALSEKNLIRYETAEGAAGKWVIGRAKK